MKIILVFLVLILLTLHAQAEEALNLHLSCEKPDGEKCVEMPFSDIPEKMNVLKKPEMRISAKDIESVKPSQDPSGTPVLTFTLKKAQAVKLKNVTAYNIGKELAIVVDGRVYMAPKIQTPIGQGAVALYAGKEDGTWGKKLGWLRKMASKTESKK